MAHATVDDLKTYLGIAAATTTDDALLRDLLERASAYVDGYTGRRFTAETETRYYEDDALDADGMTLHLDEDLYSVTGITNGDSDATSITSSDYVLMPRFGPPYHAVRMKTSSTESWTVDADDWIEIAGKWGWSESAPDDVVQAVIRLAGFYYHQKDASVYDVQAFPEAGVMTVPQGVPADVKLLLGRFRKTVG